MDEGDTEERYADTVAEIQGPESANGRITGARGVGAMEDMS
jgi:hypothetical protein